jgi:hypothetical protein
MAAKPAVNNDTQRIGMTTPIDHQRHEINSADGRCQRRLVAQVICTGAATIALLALFAAAPLGTGTVASGSVHLVDQTTDLSAQPPAVVLPPGTVLPPGAVVLPGGLPPPPLPPGVLLPPEVPQMLMQGMQMLASPPPNVPNVPNVPNEVCRFNTVRVPCP